MKATTVKEDYLNSYMKHHFIIMSQVVLPDFVNIEFLQRIFHENFGKDGEVKVKRFSVSFATVKGENYASEMYRLIVEWSLNSVVQEKPIILKVKLKLLQ